MAEVCLIAFLTVAAVVAGIVLPLRAARRRAELERAEDARRRVVAADLRRWASSPTALAPRPRPTSNPRTTSIVQRAPRSSVRRRDDDLDLGAVAATYSPDTWSAPIEFDPPSSSDSSSSGGDYSGGGGDFSGGGASGSWDD